MTGVPHNWVTKDLEVCVEILDSKRVPVNSDERAKRHGDVPYYGATGQAGWIDDYIFDEELVLVGEDGAPFFEKEKNVAFMIAGKSWVNNHAHVLKAIDGVTLNKFVLHYLNHFDYKDFVGGTTRLKLNQGSLRKIPFPLPPLPEQKRIVAKLDKLFAHLDQLKARLQNIPTLLKQFRQAVLTQAVTGKLTEEWRGSASTGFPDEWNLVGIERLVKSLKSDIRTGPFGTSLKKSEHQGTGVPVWGIESIGENGTFTRLNKIFVTESKATELKSFEVKGGDIIISRSGTVGEICILPDNTPFGPISTNLMKIILDRDMVLPMYFCWLFKAKSIVTERLAELCKGSTRLFLTQSILKQIKYPIPPLGEQKEIVRRVESLFALADRIEASYNTLQKKIDHLPQAILSKAFRGELVDSSKESHKESKAIEV